MIQNPTGTRKVESHGQSTPWERKCRIILSKRPKTDLMLKSAQSLKALVIRIVSPHLAIVFPFIAELLQWAPPYPYPSQSLDYLAAVVAALVLQL